MAATTDARRKLSFGTVIVLPLQVALIALLVRCFFIQIVHGEFYQKRMAQLVSCGKPIHGEQGRILSSDGIVLACDAPRWRISIDPDFAGGFGKLSVEKRLENLYEVLMDLKMEGDVELDTKVGSWGDLYRECALKTLKKEKYKRFGELDGVDAYYRFQTWRRMGKRRGCFLAERRSARQFPQWPLAQQIIGPFDTGDYYFGIELLCHRDLQGIDGEHRLARDCRNVQLGPGEGREGVPAVHGKDVVLTIDSRVQHRIEAEIRRAKEKFDARMVTMVVLDPATGAILGAASAPTFTADPDSWFQPQAPRIDEESHRARCCLQAMNFTYEPGSIIKPFHVAIALERGIPLTKTLKSVSGKSHTLVHGKHRRTFHDVSAKGPFDMAWTIIKSSNIGMATLGLKILGKAGLMESLRRARLGEPTGVEVREQVGYTPMTQGRKWDVYSTGSVSFGYELEVTPLQMLRGYSALINGGYGVRPHLIRSIGGELRSPAPKHRVYEERISRQMRELLRRAVAQGTTLAEHGADIIRMGGKSGTSEKTGSKIHRLSYIGFAPVEDPRYLAMMVIDSPDVRTFGGKACGPPVTRVLLDLLRPEEGFSRDQMRRVEAMEITRREPPDDATSR